MAILLFTIYPALIIVPVAAIAIIILKRLRLRNEENLRYLEDMQREQTIGSLIAKYHKRPHDFEQYIADLFSFYGFDAQVTPGSNDGGKDIIMYKDGHIYFNIRHQGNSGNIGVKFIIIVQIANFHNTKTD